MLPASALLRGCPRQRLRKLHAPPAAPQTRVSAPSRTQLASTCDTPSAISAAKRFSIIGIYEPFRSQKWHRKQTLILILSRLSLASPPFLAIGHSCCAGAALTVSDLQSWVFAQGVPLQRALVRRLRIADRVHPSPPVCLREARRLRCGVRLRRLPCRLRSNTHNQCQKPPPSPPPKHVFHASERMSRGYLRRGLLGTSGSRLHRGPKTLTWHASGTSK